MTSWQHRASFVHTLLFMKVPACRKPSLWLVSNLDIFGHIFEIDFGSRKMSACKNYWIKVITFCAYDFLATQSIFRTYIITHEGACVQKAVTLTGFKFRYFWANFWNWLWLAENKRMQKLLNKSHYFLCLWLPGNTEHLSYIHYYSWKCLRAESRHFDWFQI